MAIIYLFACANYSFAADKEMKIDLSILSVKGFVKGKRYKFNEEFANKYNIAVPIDFQFIAPTSKNHLNYVNPAPGGTGIFKITFTSLEKNVQSNLQFVPFTIGLGELAARLETLKKLAQDAFIRGIPDLKRAELITIRTTKIGVYPAIEVIGRYDAGNDGVVIKHIAAIPNPTDVNGILAISNIILKNVKIDKLEDITKTNAIRGLSTFKFK